MLSNSVFSSPRSLLGPWYTRILNCQSVQTHLALWLLWLNSHFIGYHCTVRHCVRHFGALGLDRLIVITLREGRLISRCLIAVRIQLRWVTCFLALASSNFSYARVSFTTVMRVGLALKWWKIALGVIIRSTTDCKLVKLNLEHSIKAMNTFMTEYIDGGMVNTIRIVGNDFLILTKNEMRLNSLIKYGIPVCSCRKI